MQQATISPAQATLFSRYSPQNVAIVTDKLSCGCVPYKDVFTYNRWLAQGYQVMRGQHGIHLPVIVRKESEVKQDDGTIKIEARQFRTGAAVFCRHQVKSITEPKPELKAMVIVPPEVKPVDKPAQSVHTDNLMAGWRVI